MGEEDLVVKKRGAAIKLAKELKPFDLELGYEFLAVYIETITEDMKQIARDNRRLAKEIDVMGNGLTGKPFTIVVDEEPENISKLMRRFSTRINKSCGLIYETAYLDFEIYEAAKAEAILAEDEEDDDTDDD
jgi:Txe/YoeB family toxin of Txe-Axe toxin-antitoxin module